MQLNWVMTLPGTQTPSYLALHSRLLEKGVQAHVLLQTQAELQSWECIQDPHNPQACR